MFKLTKISMYIAAISVVSACSPLTNQNSTTNTSSTIPNANTIQAADAYAPEQGTGLTEQSLVTAKDFMAASANPLATQAGYDVLAKGGSAVDAMIAIQTTLGLVEPQSSGLGGGAFVVYWDNKNKKLTTFDGRETAPLAANSDLFLDAKGTPLKFMDAVVGGRSVGTPSMPMLMESLHKRYGKLAWQSLFDQPIQLANEGFDVSPRMSQSISQYAEHLARYPETKAYFLPNGEPLAVGTKLKNPQYAQAVKDLAQQGSQPFVSGKYAQNIVTAVQSATDNPGALSLQDFSKYQVIERSPVCSQYRVYDVCGMGGASSGGIAVGQIVGILNQFTPQELSKNSTDSFRILGDASRLAFSDRGKYVGDPDFVTVPTAELLSPAYLKKRADLIKNIDISLPDAPAGEVANQVANKYLPAEAIELPSTSHIVVVDAEGNVLSMTSSIENAFGSTLMANGYLLNNQLTDFSFKAADANGKLIANRVEPGKRPRSSMSPTIVMQNGEPYLAVGSPGGSRIIGYVAKTLMAHVDWGMDIQQAINYPNFLNRFGSYELEENTDNATLAPTLEGMGYKVNVRDLNSGIQGVVIKNGQLIGGADPRREGLVMGK